MYNWYLRNARALEVALYEYHFQKGTSSPVEKALKAYQNDDGGFGHGLEPDCLNPHSSPIQTWAATQIILECQLDQSDMIEGILKYLESKEAFKNKRYGSTVLSNNDYPRAPWWTYSDKAYEGWNPTASLVAFYLIYGDKSHPHYKLVVDLGKDAVEDLIQNGCQEMHELNNYLELRSGLVKSGMTELVAFSDFEDRLSKDMLSLIEMDDTKWGDYVCRPSTFVLKTSDFLSDQLTDLIQKELVFLQEQRNQEGLWDVPWSWGQFESDFYVSKRHWEGIIGLKYLKFIKSFKGA